MRVEILNKEGLTIESREFVSNIRMILHLIVLQIALIGTSWRVVVIRG